METILTILWRFADIVITFYYWLAIIHIVLSWLIGFNIVNISNPTAARIVATINNMMTPIYDWIYQFLRPIGGGMISMFDFRPMLFIIFLSLFRPMVHAMFAKIITFIN